MTDFDPRVARPISTEELRPENRRPFEDQAFEPRSPSRGLYLVVGVIAAIVMAAGLMFLSGPVNHRNDQARSPDPATLNAPANDTRTPTVPRQAPLQVPRSETNPAPERPQQ